MEHSLSAAQCFGRSSINYERIPLIFLPVWELPNMNVQLNLF
jgi:hypothetical protein